MRSAGGAALAGLIALCWTALVTAELRVFSAALAIVAGLAAAVLYLRLARRGAPARARAGWSDAVAFAIALASLAGSLPPGELILGGWDPGVYLHTAAGIVRNRSLLFTEADLAAVPPAGLGIVTRDLDGIIEPFAGMRLLPEGRVTPQFHHLYPALLAVAYSLAGIWGALLVNPLLMVAALLAAHTLARRFVPPPWSLVAPAALAVNPGMIWQSKFSTAEMLTLVLLLGGAALLVDTLESEGVPAAVPILSGLAFGAALLARYDTVIYLVPLCGVLLLAGLDRARRRPVSFVLAPLSALALHAWAHDRFVAPYYAPLGPSVRIALLAAATAAVVLIAWLSRPSGRWFIAWIASRGGALRIGAAAIFVLWVVFAWGVRPRLAPGGSAGRLAESGAGDFLFLVDLFGPAGLIVATVGVVVLLIRCRTAGFAAWLLPSILVAVVLGTNVFHDRYLMWVARRFVPAVIPLFALGLAAAAGWAAELAGKRRSGRLSAAVGLGVAALALVPVLPAASAMASAREWPGIVRWCENVAAAIPAQAAVYCDQAGFAAPLRFLHGRKTWEYHHPNPKRSLAFNELLQSLAEREVYLLSANPPPAIAGIAWQEAGRFPLRSSTIATLRHGIPRGTKERSTEMVLSRAEYAPSRTGSAMVLPVDP